MASPTFTGVLNADNGIYSGGLKATGLTTPTGSGPEMFYSGGSGFFLTYNRTGAAYLPTVFAGSTIDIRIGTSSAIAVDASRNVTVPSGATLGIGGIANSVTSGTFTPTLTNGTNVASSSGAFAHYTRVGNEVHVEGWLIVTATTAAGTNTVISINPNIASNFSAQTDALGVGNVFLGAVIAPINIEADFTNDRIMINFTANTTSAQRMNFSYTYTVI